jgi:hypothetical protein
MFGSMQRFASPRISKIEREMVRWLPIEHRQRVRFVRHDRHSPSGAFYCTYRETIGAILMDRAIPQRQYGFEVMACKRYPKASLVCSIRGRQSTQIGVR